jgi:hypothetical protein
MSASICCTASSAVRECSILEKISPNGAASTGKRRQDRGYQANWSINLSTFGRSTSNGLQ